MLWLAGETKTMEREIRLEGLVGKRMTVALGTGMEIDTGRPKINLTE